MEKEPRYNNSWKGQVLKAIIVDKIVTWRGLQRATKLEEKPLNTALAELFNLDLIEKHDQYYFVQNEQIIADYINFYQKPVRKQRLVKDHYHAELVEYVVKKPLFSGPGHQKFVEYRLNDNGTNRYVDVMRWYFREETPHIALFEIKPKIDDFGATIRQIKYYKELVNHPSEQNFGDYPQKEIFTYLVILATPENFNTFHHFRHSILASDIDFIMFVSLSKQEDKTYSLKGFNQGVFNSLSKWIQVPLEIVSTQKNTRKNFCPKCGNKLDTDSTFCGKCGTPVNN